MTRIIFSALIRIDMKEKGIIMKRTTNEELQMNVLNGFESDVIALEVPSYFEMEDQTVQSSDILALINSQFDQIYKENKMISFLLKEVTSHIK